MMTKTSGFEESEGRSIPYIRRSWPHGESITVYGRVLPQNEEEPEPGGPILTKHETPERVLWSVGSDAWAMERDLLASRQLQGEDLDDVATRQLFYAVQHIRLHPEALPGSPDGQLVTDLVREAIVTGNRHHLDRLARYVEAVNETFTRGSRARNILRAVRLAAQRRNGVPTVAGALEEFVREGGDADDANFRAKLKALGFGWLIARKAARSAPARPARPPRTGKRS